jgi:apolipoprotein D and lipocalin family protein
MKSWILWMGVLMFAKTSFASPVTTVDFVDLNRYVGAWYEIASMPQWFQRKCVKGVMAQYATLPNGRIEVINSCVQSDGTRTETLGEAKVEDSETKAKLKVSFVKLFGNYIYAFGGDYWVIDLETNYNYSVVGHPSRDYGWILARQPTLPAADLIRISENLTRQGYDTCKFIMAIQDGGNTENIPLCDYVKGL